MSLYLSSKDFALHEFLQKAKQGGNLRNLTTDELKQMRHIIHGYSCPYCGTRYMDKKEQEDCKRTCRQRTREKGKGR